MSSLRGGGNLVDGNLGVYRHTFVPKDRTMWAGYVAGAFVCLSCGFLSHYIQKNDLDEIQRRG
jgi:hypothetical protein